MNLRIPVELLGPYGVAALDGLVPLRRQGPVIDPLHSIRPGPALGSRSRPIAPANRTGVPCCSSFDPSLRTHRYSIRGWSAGYGHAGCRCSHRDKTRPRPSRARQTRPSQNSRTSSRRCSGSSSRGSATRTSRATWESFLFSASSPAFQSFSLLHEPNRERLPAR